MHFFKIDNHAFEVMSYPISYVELIATVFGILSVHLATKANILTWGTGIVNELFLFILFFQVQLYADMLLQVYFFIISLYGWYTWKKTPGKKNITSIGFQSRLGIGCLTIIVTLITGHFFSNIHLILPLYFKLEASYPYSDSFVMVLSVIATILLAKKKIESWYLWIVVNLVCVFLFFKKGIIFLGIEYIIFLGLAAYGLLNWKKQLSNG